VLEIDPITAIRHAAPTESNLAALQAAAQDAEGRGAFDESELVVDRARFTNEFGVEPVGVNVQGH
jgi:hypothetical protein